jgi:hypothetical protein
MGDQTRPGWDPIGGGAPRVALRSARPLRTSLIVVETSRERTSLKSALSTMSSSMQDVHVGDDPNSFFVCSRVADADADHQRTVRLLLWWCERRKTRYRWGRPAVYSGVAVRARSDGWLLLVAGEARRG